MQNHANPHRPTMSPPPSATGSGGYGSGGVISDHFMAWLRGEFAASNAIIDHLLTHLRMTGGEYDYEYDCVVSAVNNRRAHWGPVLHLQQYFPVTDVAVALQHAAAWRGAGGRQQGMVMRGGGRRFEHGSGYGNGNGRKGYNRSWSEFSNRESYRYNSEEGNEISKDGNSVPKERERENSSEIESCKSTITSQRDIKTELNENIETSISDKKKFIPKEFVSNEISDGKMVNDFEGLKVYDEIIDISGVQNILSWINETRNKGRAGELLGQTFITAKRPNKGHGREVIQLGIPILEGPPNDQNTPLISRERKVEEIPVVIEEMLNKLSQIISFKPDYCVIDFFNQGDHSHPSSWPNWYGRPVGTICLTECDFIFGRHIISDHKGYHKGPLEMSLSPGSLIMAKTLNPKPDSSKRAIPSTLKSRILLTFSKSLPRKSQTLNPNKPLLKQQVFVPVNGTGVFLRPPGSGEPPVAPAKSEEGEKNESEINGECSNNGKKE